MRESLYGPDGFFTRAGAGPAAHFRTSSHASAAFAGALAELVRRVDAALGHPDRLDLVDVGGGRGELMTALLPALPEPTRARVRATVVELADRPGGLPGEICWHRTIPGDLTGVVVATEWLDNVPLDVVEVDDTGTPRYVLVDSTGAERPGPPVGPVDAAWLAEWWPLWGAEPGMRAEVGIARDAAWAGAVGALTRGLAITVDYGHLRADRPPFGTLTGFRGGRQVQPTPDGSCDLTAHVAFDSVAAAGARDVPPTLLTQRKALRALGATGGRPPLELATSDPATYVRRLAAAGLEAELTDPGGLGGHYWLIQPVGLTVPVAPSSP
ncbi:MAG: hypothetical protein QOE03_2841 [Micromonosporaceae bacterium]|nr:hypothetical protein [Micromonosporaceae bacterium]